jgi:hypothetical protein
MTLPYDRSTRRTTKLGSYGEQLLEHWLSRDGFHTARADAEGIDILAVHVASKLRLGFSMKARFYPTFRQAGILHKSSLPKVRASCDVWTVEPWIAVYVEAPASGLLIAMPLEVYLQSYVHPDSTWYMLNIRPPAIEVLRKDPKVHIVEFNLGGSWFPSHQAQVAE